MSAANFAVLNARKYYVVSEVPEYTGLQLPGWNAIKENSPSAWEKGNGLERSYPGAYIMEKNVWLEFCKGEQYSVTAKIILRSGYYSGAVLDWNIFGDAYTGALSEYRDGLEEFASEIVSSYLDSMEYYNGWNKGFQKIMRPRFLEKLSKALEGLAEECENICRSLAEDTYICGGVFSNGEAVYYMA